MSLAQPNSRSRRAIAACAAALLVVLLGSGCSFSFSVGGGPTSEDLADAISASYEAKTDLALRGFSCAEVEVSEGAEFSCSGTNASDVEIEVGGEITNVEGSEFDYSWNVVRAVASGALYAAEAKRTIERETGEAVATVACPERVEVEPGRTIRCRVRAPDGRTATAVLLLTDADGGFRINVREDGGQAPPT